MAARPFVLVSDATLASIRAHALTGLTQWWARSAAAPCAGDGATRAVLDVQVHRAQATDLTDLLDQPLGTTQRIVHWHGTLPERQAALHQALFGGPPPLRADGEVPLSLLATTQALSALELRWSEIFPCTSPASDSSTDTPPPRATEPLRITLQRPGHGLVRLSVALVPHGPDAPHMTPLFTLVQRAAHLQLTAAPSNIAPGVAPNTAGPAIDGRDRDRALRGARAAVQLELGQAELTLADLLSLRTGDVVPLNRTMDEALILRSLPDGNTWPVHLGRQGEHLAVQILGSPRGTAP